MEATRRKTVKELTPDAVRLVLFLPPKMKQFLEKEVVRRKGKGENRANMNWLIREAIREKYPQTAAMLGTYDE